MVDFPDELAEHYIAVGREQAELDLIRRLIDSGLSPESVINLGVHPQIVNQVLHVHFSTGLRTPEDDELVSAARKLAKKVIAKADLLLDTAPLSTQVTIMRAITPAVARMVGNTQGESYEEAHQALSALLSAQRVDPASPRSLPSSSGLAALIESVNDSDEEPDS